MINIFKIDEPYQKVLPYIKEIFIEEYGENYQSRIEEAIQNLFTNFESDPLDNYFYALDHQKEFTPEEMQKLKEENDNYAHIEQESYKIIEDKLESYILKAFPIKNREDLLKVKDVFYSYNFSLGYIDYFCVVYKKILNEKSMQSSEKEKIKKKQILCEQFLKKIGLSIKDISQESIENFIKFREEMVREYKSNIIEKSNYGQQMKKKVTEACENNEATYEELNIMCLFESPSSGVIRFPNTPNKYHFIKYPIITLWNRGSRAIDVSIIHELIHRIEYHEKLENNKEIIREIRTQFLAIKITKKLHARNIYIYDNPAQERIEGESFYEYMFPLCSAFLEKYDVLFKEFAMHDPLKIVEIFGESWNEFSQYIDYVFYTIFPIFYEKGVIEESFITEGMRKTTENLIACMEMFSKQKGHTI